MINKKYLITLQKEYLLIRKPEQFIIPTLGSFKTILMKTILALSHKMPAIPRPPYFLDKLKIRGGGSFFLINA